MNPNPNPSPELIDEMTREIWDAAPIRTHAEARELADTLAALSQTLPAPGEVEARQAVIERGRDALRYLLNWSTTGSRVSTIMKTFTFDGDEKITTGQRLEELWSALNEPSLTTVAAANDEGVAEAFARGVEAAAKVCEDQQQVFLSTQYATGQPLSSFHERFACGQCAAAIRLLSQGGGK